MTSDEAVLIVKTMVGSMWRLTEAQRAALRVLLAEREAARDTVREALSLLAGDGKDMGILHNHRAERAEQRARPKHEVLRQLADTVERYEALQARLREVEAERVRAREEWTAALLKSEAEVQALRDGAADLLEATKNWSDIRIHDARNKLRAALREGALRSVRR